MTNSTAKNAIISLLNEYIAEQKQDGGAYELELATKAKEECLPVIEGLDNQTAEAAYAAFRAKEESLPFNITPTEIIKFIPNH